MFFYAIYDDPSWVHQWYLEREYRLVMGTFKMDEIDEKLIDKKLLVLVDRDVTNVNICYLDTRKHLFDNPFWPYKSKVSNLEMF
jgi:hypothetical protein